MARALWKGAISFGLVTIPVALYPAKSSRSNVSFHMLHKDDLRRIRQERVDDEGHQVPFEDVVKGYEYEKDQYVVITDEDLEKANVEATQTIDIMHFVDAHEVDIAYYDAPYYTEPSKAGRKAYALLRETLKRTDRIGVAKLVIRERQHLCAVIADGPALLAYTLRWPYQLREASDFDLPSEDLDDIGVSPQELKMAEQLVDAMTTTWEPEQYRDTYREDLLRLIDEKVKGGKVTEAPAPAREARESNVVDIMALLKRSMEQQKGGAAAGDDGSADGSEQTEARAKKRKASTSKGRKAG